jgi:hypothetical protein
MTAAPPTLPWPMRAANGVGGALARLGVRLVPLDTATLLAQARRRTGLGDFGDDAFHEGLGRLLWSHDHEAALTTTGRLAARTETLRLLENRLRMEAVHAAHPEIAVQPVRAPIFILGLPRTGTSILHELLAQDPANRVPWTWETMWPWPPPEQGCRETDPRIARAEAHFARIDRLLPEFKKMHPMGAHLPQECVALLAHDFATVMHHTTHEVPSYQRWLESLDRRPAYRAHRRQLQYLQWRWPAERWVLKSPEHLWALDALLAVYPDARIVQTHRDPLEVLASLVSLVAYLRSLASERIDPRAIAADWTARLAAGLEHTMRVRDAAALGPDRVFDLRLGDFVGDEIAAIRRLYERFGMVLSPEAEARMRAFLGANPKDKHGTHRYTLAAAGLDTERERARYRAYAERFDV